MTLPTPLSCASIAIRQRGSAAASPATSRPVIAENVKIPSNFMDKKFENLTRRLEKIVINVGLGRLRTLPQFEEKVLPEIMKELMIITGQKPAPRAAKKSVAGFRVRQGEIIGLQTTLRHRRLKDFLGRLINIVLPRVKDFRGIDLKHLDKGNILNFGLREQYVFPEINADQSKVNFGLQVTIVPKPEYRKEAVEAYRNLGIPFKTKK